jgi:hypothetical protein
LLLFHGSEPNPLRRASDRVRDPLYPDVSQASRRFAGRVTLVRGRDTHHNFEPAYVPKRDLEPEALKFHRMVSEQQVRVLYRGTGKTAYRS